MIHGFSCDHFQPINHGVEVTMIVCGPFGGDKICNLELITNGPQLVHISEGNKLGTC